jgi:hypothetical protein
MEYLTPIVIGGVVPAVVIAVLRCLLNSRQHQAMSTEDGCVVQYGRALKIFVGVMAIAAGGLVSVVAVLPPVNWWPPVFLAIFFCLFLVPLYLEYFHVRIVVTEERLQCRSPWRAARDIRWEEVKSVDFSPSLQWYRIRTEGKGIVRLHVFLSGLQTLFDLLRRKTGIEVEQPPSSPW